MLASKIVERTRTCQELRVAPATGAMAVYVFLFCYYDELDEDWHLDDDLDDYVQDYRGIYAC